MEALPKLHHQAQLGSSLLSLTSIQLPIQRIGPSSPIASPMIRYRAWYSPCARSHQYKAELCEISELVCENFVYAICYFVNDSDNFLLKIDSFARLKKLVRTFSFCKIIAFFVPYVQFPAGRHRAAAVTARLRGSRDLER